MAKKDYVAKASLRTVAGLSGACTLLSRRIRAVNLLIGSYTGSETSSSLTQDMVVKDKAALAAAVAEWNAANVELPHKGFAAYLTVYELAHFINEQTSQGRH